MASIYRARRRLITFALLSVTIVVAAGCGSDADPEDRTALSALASQGRDIVASAGCASCHGDAGEGVIGPSWRGLAGSEVTLTDGTVVTADADYIRRSIAEPDAQIVEGYTVRMPANALTPTEVDAVVAYILELR